MEESDKDEALKKAPKAVAQVETSVAHSVRQKSGELKLGDETGQKSRTLGVRFRAEELVIIKLKAKVAGCSTNSYIRAAVLDSDYKPPINPELQKTLFAINRELTAQGNNLNQIARQLNGNIVTPDQGIAMLDVIRVPLIRALYAVKNALVQGEELPP